MYRQINFEQIETSPDCISGYDRDLNIVIWNSTVANRFAIPAAEALNKNLLSLFPHIRNDFRIECFRQTLLERKVFFFTAMPYLYETGTYTQLILPVKDKGACEVLSIVRDHEPGEQYISEDLLSPLAFK